ncbi:hypothetical protein RhiXN_08578 [Rhizoctonia solani]|uniref:Uncharacterized protein n=1 Tax=Rhizoctonia solani TaxID=456999 RepID=A0A8H8P3A3_9AGAM|nr:uncharacterized protein RhiXN_08578 [Rhizoctonia solani]QRW23542.1 hypothetical protein RhiXN_08578 [Rhizoctonia solani]
MPRRAEYEFKQPTKELTYCAQLQEWADFYKVKLNWVDADVQTMEPQIKEYGYPEFTAPGKSLRDARQLASQQIIDSPGKLEFAKNRPAPPTIYHTR